MVACGSSEKPPDGGGLLSASLGKSFASVVSGMALGEKDIALGVVSTFRGEPALRVSHQGISFLSEPFRNALVGRFAFSGPPMELIRKFLSH